MLYTVAMLKKEDDLQLVTLIRDGIFYEADLHKVEEMQKDGYELESCVITNKREVFYKNKLKGRTAMYMKYLEDSHTLLVRTKKEFGKDSETFKTTLRMVNEYRDTMKKQIAVNAVRCLDLGVPIDDLAMEIVFERNCELERGAM